MTEVTVQVIVPARNEEDCIARCLQSLTSQKGINYRITVVDDGSADRTREIAESFPGVQVVSPGDPAPGVSGKCNALIAGSKGVDAKWILFTDADTFHYSGSLAAAVAEAEEHGADLLSYSPEQETGSLFEDMLMPVVYAELTRTYRTERVNDPNDPAAAANGQYILVRRKVYEALEGHAAVADKLLEDVELARIFKQTNHKILFRFGAGRVRTRMYRSFAAMWEGWTKNLAILFNYPLRLAAERLIEFYLIAILLGLALTAAVKGDVKAFAPGALLGLIVYASFMNRIRRAHFPWRANLLSFLGLPLFSLLLVRSWLHSARGEVTWKGRKYLQSAPKRATDSSKQG